MALDGALACQKTHIWCLGQNPRLSEAGFVAKMKQLVGPTDSVKPEYVEKFKVADYLES